MKHALATIAAFIAMSGAAGAIECSYRQAPYSADLRQALEGVTSEAPYAQLLRWRALTEAEPGNTVAWRWRADVERKLGESMAAAQSLDRVLELDPCDYHARVARGQAAEKAGALPAAYDDYTLAIEVDPTKPAAYELRGALLLRAALFPNALADFNAALERGPASVDLLLNRGGVFQERGEYPRAIADYDRALQIEPGNLDALAARGYTRFFLRDYDGAAEDFEPVAEALDENALVWFFLARSRLGDPDAAEDFAIGAARLPQGRWMRDVAEPFLTGRPDEDLLRTAEEPVQRCSAWFYLGEVALGKGDSERAKQAFLAAADACPIDPVRYSGSLREYVGATEELKLLQ